METSVFPIVAAGGTIASILYLLRQRHLREKYAFLWLVVAVCVAVIAVFPELLFVASDVLGVKTPSNLLFFVAALVLLVVCVQLSAEVSRLEDETRILAEEFGILRLRVEEALPPGEPREGAWRSAS